MRLSVRSNNGLSLITESPHILAESMAYSIPSGVGGGPADSLGTLAWKIPLVFASTGTRQSAPCCADSLHVYYVIHSPALLLAASPAVPTGASIQPSFGSQQHARFLFWSIAYACAYAYLPTYSRLDIQVGVAVVLWFSVSG